MNYPPQASARDWALYFLNTCRTAFLPPWNDAQKNQADERLMRDTLQAFHAWQYQDPASYREYFATVPLDVIAAIQKVNDRTVSRYADATANDLLARVEIPTAARASEIVRGLEPHGRSHGALAFCDHFHAVYARAVQTWRSLDAKGLDDWLATLPAEAWIPDGLHHRSAIELVWSLLPPTDPETRRQVDRRLAERVRASYRQTTGPGPQIVGKAQQYLASEVAMAASGAKPDAHRCGCCGAMASPADSRCDYCGTVFVRTSEGTATKVSLDHLCPFTFLGGTTYDLCSAAATTSNLKTLALDGTFDDGLDTIIQLVDWYKGIIAAIDNPVADIVNMLSAASGAINRALMALARQARGKPDRARQVVSVAVRWKRDVLKESVSAGMFASKEKKDAAWEQKIREELSLF